ncbi:hypothetical protein L3Q82_000393 [Scortum barcoo]|uniref:Uncharacterized protein n=1 Tax=Scortum barcoo TaxID=214431 RepID=A0ACB8X9L4_9TELE|nr:hypothetical protein L3Q82_000393 [Scortum barcoo]
MKALERIVLRHLRPLVSPNMDPLQFAYQPGIGVDDAIIYLLHRSLSHLEDAGNTDCVSDVVVCSTGAPQGTVLSPFLFTLYTSDFTYSTDSCHLQKFSNDTAIVGCVSEGNDCEYRKVIMDFVDWCELNHLQVNASKTKEMSDSLNSTRRTLVQKLTTLGLSLTLCNWVLDFLTDRPQSVRIHDVSSSSISLSTGFPPGLCAEPPPVHPAHTRLLSDTSELSDREVFADDTAVVGRIANANNDESDYRQEVEHLEGWCRQNNLCINVKKTKEMIVDFRRGRHLPSPLYIGGTAVEVVSSFRYLGVHISDDLTWSKNTSCLIRKAHQRLYFLRRLRRAGLGSSVLTSPSTDVWWRASCPPASSCGTAAARRQRRRLCRGW